MIAVSRTPTFALLDDAVAPAGVARSRLLTDWQATLRCADPRELDRFWQQVQDALGAGLFALVVADYEFGVRLAGLPVRHAAQGALRVLLYARQQRLDGAGVAAWLNAQEEAGDAIALQAFRQELDDEQFTARVRQIQQAIRAGETYQVNLTDRLSARCAGPLVALYARLRARQPVPYGAFIQWPAEEGGGALMSFSPELFLRHEDGQLTARPMKGTAARASDIASDLLAREQLAQPKNRAENLMIVDLLRNDLGRVAVTGSVSVPGLFEVEAHPTVWQMTSTISARLRPECGFVDVLRGLYPCGSITGAPKHRTMQLIDRLESSARGVYCGTLGWVDARADDAETACEDFCLSVPIRSFALSPPQAGWRALRLGIGAGIVADSDAAQEAEECRLKARFLTQLEDDLGLIETMRAEGGAIALRGRHLQRLAQSAAALGLRCDLDAIALQLDACLSSLPPGPQRVRLLLRRDGRCELTTAPLDPLPPGPVRIALAAQPIDADAWPLAHKTTVRGHYERSLSAAQTRGVFDLLHFNLRGELTEGARSNLLLRIDGQWLTPALACGVLPGVMRASLFDDPRWQVREAVMTRDDLRRANDVCVCNALRGVVPAVLV